jgi:hypothetical protein
MYKTNTVTIKPEGSTLMIKSSTLDTNLTQMHLAPVLTTVSVRFILTFPSELFLVYQRDG